MSELLYQITRTKKQKETTLCFINIDLKDNESLDRNDDSTLSKKEQSIVDVRFIRSWHENLVCNAEFPIFTSTCVMLASLVVRYYILFRVIYRITSQ